MKNLAKRLPSLFKNRWPVVLITFLVFIFFWKFFIKGLAPIPGDFVTGVYYPWLDYKWGFTTGVPVKNPIVADVPSFMYPMQTLASDMLKSGQFALWNPYILAGNPLLANFQSAPFSIVNILYFLTDKVNAWSIQIIIQHILAALFAYVLLRYWKVSKLGSSLGGIIYAFSGFNLIWSQWNGHTLSASFIPLILYFEDGFLKESKLKFGVFISIILALQICSGYPQVVLYTAIVMGILFLFRVYPIMRKNMKKAVVSTVLLSVFCVLGIGLSAPQWIPGAELLKLSQRIVEYHPFEWAFLPWSKAITFIASDFYGNHATKNYWGPQDYTSNTGFVGVIGFILALLSISLLKKREEVLICLTILIVSLLLAFPTPLSIFLWKTGILGFNAASAHRSLILWNLSVALLSAFGYDGLAKAIKLRSKIISILIVFAMIVGFGIYAYIVRARTTYGASVLPIAMRNLVIPSGIFLLSSLVILVKPKLKFIFIGLAVIELFYFGWKFTPFFNKYLIFPKTPVLDFLMSREKPFRVTGNKVIPMNMRMIYGLESPEGYDAVYPAWIAKILSSLNDVSSATKFTGRYGFVDREDSRLLDLLNTKYFLALKLNDRGSPDISGKNLLAVYGNPKFKKVFEDKTVVVLENKNVLPRAFMVYDWDIIPDGNHVLDKLLDEKYPLSKKIILNEEVPGISRTTTEYTGRVSYQIYKENSSLINIETPEAGMLFTSDTFYPGWKAYLDGKETKIYKADFAFRAVAVPKGSHKLEFAYHPESFFGGLKISAISLLSLLALIGYTSLKYRNRDVKN